MYNTGFLVIYAHSVYCQVLDPEEFSQEYMDFVIFYLDSFFEIYAYFLSAVQVELLFLLRSSQLNCRALYGASAAACGMNIKCDRFVL